MKKTIMKINDLILYFQNLFKIDNSLINDNKVKEV